MKTLLTDLVLDGVNDMINGNNQFCNNFSCNEAFIEFSSFSQPPYFLVILGVIIGIICGATFAKQIEYRLNQWKKYNLSLLPLRTVQLHLSYTGILLGTILFISGSLQIFGLQYDTAFFVGLCLSLVTGGALWVQLEQFMKQVENGEFKVVDFDNFDQFF
ncbi:hypothetical protein PMYN1_Chma716 (chromatophore) [Paulinella micropora]|uniref:Uncharacterized protein n=1 Tax=Paulinella micropora TaxID=1928728 RepID=A0A1L5YCW0_9EUKA|nr:hypothetical protein PCKR_772 [Paulinella micropora]AQX45303.1 hypothetical protein PFK_772 [Paulinella micropora]BBL86521.1 hypothetical protein PMYN1_Chma716 [Paulinella micropora]